jgi:hypothetical protein
MSDAIFKSAQILEAKTVDCQLAAADPGRDPIPRRMYISMRLEEISMVVGEMVKERETLTAHLKAPPSKPGPEPKQLRLRRAYLAQRIHILRVEQATLKSEKKDMGARERLPN